MLWNLFFLCGVCVVLNKSLLVYAASYIKVLMVWSVAVAGCEAKRMYCVI